MDYKTDTAIIGGGPAGICCAIRLKQLGVPCIVIERKAYPRKKTCGGMMTEKTYLAIDEILGGADDLECTICGESDSLSIYKESELLVSANPSKKFRFVKREIFDGYLAGKFSASGGEIIEDAVCRTVDPESCTLELSNGDTVSYRHIVVADGAKSATRKMLGYPEPGYGFCVETHVLRSALSDFDGPRIYFGVVKTGYAWVFPSGEDLCIGLGEIYDKDTPYVEILKQFVEELGIDPGQIEIEGAFVPSGTVRIGKRTFDKVILIGDAGGFLHPIFGEGLYYAAVTGKLAAEAIAHHPDKAAYEFRNSASPIFKTIKTDGALQKLFYKRPFLQKFYTKIKGKDDFVAYFSDRCLSEDTSGRGLREFVKEYKNRE